MAAALVAGAFLTSFVNVLFDRLSSPEVVNWINGKKLDEKLCRRLKRTLTVVRVVLNDAEQKQITDCAVKEWLADLEDAVYKADDLLDEISTKALAQKDAEMLPIGMQDLVNLRHLDISGTPLKEMPKGMSKLKHLQFLSGFVVGKYEENGISELGALANLHGSLCIDKSENVTSSDEALKARMADKKHITDLTLMWSLDASFLDSQVERDILDKLQPHKELINLEIKGYRGTKFPDWLGHSSYCNMAKLNLNSCMNCCRLPSLGQLPSLKDLFISSFDGVEIIGDEFYGIDESCCETPFPSLEYLTFNEMCCWREWRSYKLDVFPRLKELTIHDCPMLTGDLPNHLPALENLSIHRCKQLACSLPRAPAILKIQIAGCDVLRIQGIPLSLRSLSLEGTQLVESAFEAMTRTLPTCLRELDIANCSSSLSFPGNSIPASLEIMHIWNCPKLEFPMQQEHESLQQIDILRSCDSLTSFHLGSFPHLTKVAFGRCANIKSLVSAPILCPSPHHGQIHPN